MRNLKNLYPFKIDSTMRTLVKTKHFFLFAVIFIISLCNVCAQQENSSKKKCKKEIFAFGPKYAVNFTSINKAINKEFLPGADLGLFFRFSIARFYIQPEVNYVIRRTNAMTTWDGTYHNNYTTHLISLPVFVGYKIVDLKFFKLRPFIGPEFNFGMNHLMTNDFQLGFQAGLGFDIWRFTIDAGYSYLVDLDFTEVRYNVFKVGLGFKCF